MKGREKLASWKHGKSPFKQYLEFIILMSDEKNWLDKITHWFDRVPEDKMDLLELLKEIKEAHIIDAESLAMIEGVLQVSDLKTEQIMIPRTQIIAVTESESLAEFLPKIAESGHSRFPVFDDKLTEVKGILFAKDLLQLLLPTADKAKFNISEYIRPAMVVPETKRLDSLLQEFKYSHQHMAIAVDEYGGISGLVTIEDVLEQIVGEIDDEHDMNGDEVYVKSQPNGAVVVKTRMPLEEFNQYFGTRFDVHSASTIGGYLLNQWHRLPRRNEILRLDNLIFTVVRADHRRLHLVSVRHEI